MKAVHPSETKVNSCQTVWCQISEDSSLHTHCQGISVYFLPFMYPSQCTLP